MVAVVKNESATAATARQNQDGVLLVLLTTA
jgi:hypothetical protein